MSRLLWRIGADGATCQRRLVSISIEANAQLTTSMRLFSWERQSWHCCLAYCCCSSSPFVLPPFIPMTSLPIYEPRPVPEPGVEAKAAGEDMLCVERALSSAFCRSRSFTRVSSSDRWAALRCRKARWVSSCLDGSSVVSGRLPLPIVSAFCFCPSRERERKRKKREDGRGWTTAGTRWRSRMFPMLASPADRHHFFCLCCSDRTPRLAVCPFSGRRIYVQAYEFSGLTFRRTYARRPQPD